MPPSTSTTVGNLLARDFLRTSKTFHIDETRSIFPNLGCGKIVDCPCCCCNLDLCSMALVEAASPIAPSWSSSLLLRMKYCNFSSCVSPNHFQQSSSNNHRPEDFPVHQTRSQPSAPGQLPPRNHESEQRFSELCTLQAQTITTSANHRCANQRCATMMKHYDCVSQYAVNLFLEPFTKRAQ